MCNEVINCLQNGATRSPHSCTHSGIYIDRFTYIQIHIHAIIRAIHPCANCSKSSLALRNPNAPPLSRLEHRKISQLEVIKMTLFCFYALAYCFGLLSLRFVFLFPHFSLRLHHHPAFLNPADCCCLYCRKIFGAHFPTLN